MPQPEQRQCGCASCELFAPVRDEVSDFMDSQMTQPFFCRMVVTPTFETARLHLVRPCTEASLPLLWA
ncbi:hypothetical protein DEJ23_10135 [Curtobacterium sp. MCSS17_008]|nr:hypothetical protein DEJ23_10135 [Curtobacterium sp. MCSS17_008]